MMRCLSLAFLGTAAALKTQQAGDAAIALQAGDAVTLLQAQTDVHSHVHGSAPLELDISQIPGLNDMFKNMMPGGASGGGASGAPAAPAMPSMEEMMSMANEVLKTLRNDTVIAGIDEMMSNLSTILNTSTAQSQERFTQLGETLSSSDASQVIPVTARFLETEVLSLRPKIKIGYETLARFVRSLDMGNKSRQIKLSVAMAMPLLLQSFDTMMEPVVGDIETLGNSSSKKQFCLGMVPLFMNSSKLLGALRNASAGIQQAAKMVPKIRQTPLQFMAPDVVPKIEKMAGQCLSLDTGLVGHVELMCNQLNTTVRKIVFDKLNCDAEMSGVSRGASLAALLFAAVALLLTL